MYISKVLRGVKKNTCYKWFFKEKKMKYNNPELILMINKTMKIPSHYKKIDWIQEKNWEVKRKKQKNMLVHIEKQNLVSNKEDKSGNVLWFYLFLIILK